MVHGAGVAGRRACASRRRRAAGRSRPRRSRRRTRGRSTRSPRRPRGGRASRPTAPSRPDAPPRRCSARRASGAGQQRGQQRRAGRREAPRGGLLLAVGAHEHRARRARALVGGERGVQRDGRARLELGVLVEQQAEAPAGALQQRAVVRRLPAPARRARSPRSSPDAGGRPPPSRPGRRCRAPAPRSRSRRCPLARDRVQAVAQQAALLGVDHAEGELDGHEGLHPAAQGRRWRAERSNVDRVNFM